jgi:hypothetical protein
VKKSGGKYPKWYEVRKIILMKKELKLFVDI